MTTRNLIINQLARFPKQDSDDRLEFQPGVNVIVGRPNAGKTMWLRMLDYLMGDPDPPEKALTRELSEKYESVEAVVQIGDEEMTFKRHWKRKGSRSKVFVNDVPIDVKDFSAFLLQKLQIPMLHFPKGSPYSERKWPELSWRTLLRHIYRQQTYWGDIAQKQPETEQFACLMQFLGIAEHLFSEQHNELVEKRKEIWQLEGAKKQFTQILDQISGQLLDDADVSVTPTEESIDRALSRIQHQISELEAKQERMLLDLTSNTVENLNTVDESREKEGSTYQQLAQERVALQSEYEEEESLLHTAEKRLAELREYRLTVSSEISRMKRAQSAGNILGNLKLTHCPACDQTVKPTHTDPDQCYLCGQPLLNDNQSNVPETGLQRVHFELEQLEAEQEELNDLISTIQTDLDTKRKRKLRIEDRLQRIELQLAPFRRAAASILPPDIPFFNIEIGRQQEKHEQLRRVKETLKYRERLSDEIDETERKVKQLQIEINQESQKINMQKSKGILSEGMNTYLNALNVNGTSAWSQKGIDVHITSSTFGFTVDGDKWSSKLGGTLILYFLLSYHYALLSLSNREERHYPGLLLLDFPATMEDGSTVEDKENFVLAPFVDLANRMAGNPIQVIAAGSSFAGLEGANRIMLQSAW